MSQEQTKSLDWQRREMAARRQRGQTQHQLSVYEAENFVLAEARKLTGIAQGQFLRLMAIEPGFCLASLEADIVALAYKLEESQKTSLRAVEDVEREISEYARSIRTRLIAVEETLRQDWAALGEVR